MNHTSQKDVDEMEAEFVAILEYKGLQRTPRARAKVVEHLKGSNVTVTSEKRQLSSSSPLVNGYEIADAVLRSACVYAKRGVDVSSRESLGMIADEVAERVLELTDEDPRKTSAWGGWERLLCEHENAWMKHYPHQWSAILRWEKALVA